MHSKGGFYSVVDQHFKGSLELAKESADYRRLFLKTHKIAQLLQERFAKKEWIDNAF